MTAHEPDDLQPGEHAALGERIGSYLYGYDGHEEDVPWDSLGDDNHVRRAYIKKGAGLADEFSITAPDLRVRNVSFNPNALYGGLTYMINCQAEEGFALLRIVPFTTWEAVAVFERLAATSGRHNTTSEASS